MHNTAVLKDILSEKELDLLNDTFPELIEKWVFMLTIKDLRVIGAIINSQLSSPQMNVDYDSWCLEVIKNRAKLKNLII
jgi:hypothetical protein